MALTDTAVKNSKFKGQPFKRYDEKALYLLINKAGKYWRFDYRAGGKRKTLALGVYPDVSLAAAREKRDAARKLLASGMDPGMAKQQQKRAVTEAGENSFEVIAREWFCKFSAGWVASHSDKIIRRLERNVFPWIGARPISAVTAPELLTVLRRIESRGAIETAHRALQNCGQIFRYAVSTGARAERDPSSDLRGALATPDEKHHASITDAPGVAELLRAIRGYQGTLVTKCALQIAPLVFVRPGELRKGEWKEFDLDGAEWRIPAERMKMREQHIVPLSRQAVAILRDLHSLSGKGRYVFTGARTNGRPMSENTVNAALRRLGYAKDQMTGHGFRSMASTMLHEQGWTHQAIERQLAHAERNAVSAAYNFAEHLPERRKMMQAWADYLDGLNAGGNVIPIGRNAA